MCLPDSCSPELVVMYMFVTCRQHSTLWAAVAYNHALLVMRKASMKSALAIASGHPQHHDDHGTRDVGV